MAQPPSRINQTQNVLPTTFRGSRRLALTLTLRKRNGDSSGDDRIYIDLRPSHSAENGRVIIDNPNPIVIIVTAIEGKKVKVVIEADPIYSVDRESVYERKKRSQ